MVNGKIRLDGKKHSIPEEFLDVFQYLQSIEGIEEVGSGRFTDKGTKNGRKYTIKYYDATTKKMKLEIKGQKSKQDFFLRINPDSIDGVKRYLEGIINFL